MSFFAKTYRAFTEIICETKGPLIKVYGAQRTTKNKRQCLKTKKSGKTKGPNPKNAPRIKCTKNVYGARYKKGRATDF